MKLLIHQPRLSYFIGGGETVPLQQAEALNKMGHDVEILTTKTPEYSSVFKEFKDRNSKILIHELELNPKQKYIYDQAPGQNWSRWDSEALYFGQNANEFYRNAGDYDLVVTHLLSDSLFVPLRYKNVLHLHGVPSEWRSFDDIFLTRPDHFVSVSKYVKEGWIKLYPKLGDTTIDVSHNGIDTTRFTDIGKKRDIDMLFVGRLIETKGLTYIIEALSLLKKRAVNFNKLVIVGKGPEREKLESLINQHNLVDKIGFLSDLPTETLIDYYNRSKLFLCPSYDKEGVLTTMLEAGSCGSAIITADCCGMIEFAKDNVNSFVVRPRNSEDLAQNIEKALSDDKSLEKIKTQAKKDLVNKWDIEHTLSILSNIYEGYLK